MWFIRSYLSDLVFEAEGTLNAVRAGDVSLRAFGGTPTPNSMHSLMKPNDDKFINNEKIE